MNSRDEERCQRALVDALEQIARAQALVLPRSKAAQVLPTSASVLRDLLGQRLLALPAIPQAQEPSVRKAQEIAVGLRAYTQEGRLSVRRRSK
jgi:hypothetical protein